MKMIVGITLANSFPSLEIMHHDDTMPAGEEKGRIVGMAGKGILPISLFTLAKVADMSVLALLNDLPHDARCYH